jgi:transposase-like protein
MIAFCPTCGHENETTFVRFEASNSFVCDRCGADVARQQQPTLGDIAQALEEIEQRLAGIGQRTKL